MIGRLRGNILEKQPPQVLLEANGIGYEVYMPMSCFYKLPKLGQDTIIFTHFVVREDAQLLYGFNNQQERALFRALIKVNGVGPKLALAILSSMPDAQFINAIEQEAITSLVKIPGVGKKTAERLVVEMKDSFKSAKSDLLSNHGDLPAVSSPIPQAEAALVALGYKPQEASRLVNKIAKPGIDCETLIRHALRAAL